MPDLLVSKEEKEKFEITNELSSDRSLGTREREGLQKTIGVLTQMYIEAKYDNTDKANVNAVARDILEYVDFKGVDTSGLANSTLRDRLKDSLAHRIKDALELI